MPDRPDRGVSTRYQITLTAASPGTLQKLLAAVREKGTLARNDRIAVDVDPVSLL